MHATSGPEEAIGRTLDLSVSGAADEIPVNIEVDDLIERGIGDVITINAQVVRKHGKHIGVRFINCGPAEQRLIDSSFWSRIIEPEMKIRR